jgi:hypothetical protein
MKVDWPKIIYVDRNLNALSSRDELLRDKESINVCSETLKHDVASTMAKLRAVQYTNRGFIPSKGKEFSLRRNVHAFSGAHPISLMGVGDDFP